MAIGSAGKVSSQNFTLTGEGQFEFSSNKNNIIVLLADGFDESDFLPVLDEEPSFREYFYGFTFYQDTCGISLFSDESTNETFPRK